MRIPSRFRVGSSTHTGLVRSANEDDYLVLVPPDSGARLLAAVADGMGGVAGGTEASRCGLRGLAAHVLGAGDAEPEAALAGAFAAAHERVLEQASLVPALHEMGTTLTALWFQPDRVHVGHVGDTRAYRLRAGTLLQLTTDHASKEQRNRLLRCIGGGMPAEPPDLAAHDLQTGDRFLLCSDGLWGVVPEPRLRELLAPPRPAAAAAEVLVAAALSAGGPDNATAVVVDVVDGGDELVEVALPTEEASRRGDLDRRVGRAPPRWPILVLFVAAALVAAVVARVAFDLDVLGWIAAAF